MTDFSAAVQKPGYTGVAPTYSALTGTDKFTAAPNGRYMLHYKNGATSMAAGTLTVQDTTTPTPAGATVVANQFDAVTVPTFMGATSELIAWIDNANRFRDNLGFINLLKTGSPVFTTMTVAIFGPF
jgi:hypothetical protein